MDEIEYISRKYGVSPVFVEKLSFYNMGDDLEQVVIDQLDYLKGVIEW
jgi:hypothetical protein